MIKLEDLTRKDLIKLCNEYDHYIKDKLEDEQNIVNNYPVCISEYINNEFCNNNKIETITPINAISFEIISVFENVLKEHDILLPSEDREGNEEEACIYGTEYYDIEDSISDILRKYL